MIWMSCSLQKMLQFRSFFSWYCKSKIRMKTQTWWQCIWAVHYIVCPVYHELMLALFDMRPNLAPDSHAKGLMFACVVKSRDAETWQSGRYMICQSARFNRWMLTILTLRNVPEDEAEAASWFVLPEDFAQSLKVSRFERHEGWFTALITWKCFIIPYLVFQ